MDVDSPKKEQDALDVDVDGSQADRRSQDSLDLEVVESDGECEYLEVPKAPMDSGNDQPSAALTPDDKFPQDCISDQSIEDAKTHDVEMASVESSSEPGEVVQRNDEDLPVDVKPESKDAAPMDVEEGFIRNSGTGNEVNKEGQLDRIDKNAEEISEVVLDTTDENERDKIGTEGGSGENHEINPGLSPDVGHLKLEKDEVSHSPDVQTNSEMVSADATRLMTDERSVVDHPKQASENDMAEDGEETPVNDAAGPPIQARNVNNTVTTNATGRQFYNVVAYLKMHDFEETLMALKREWRGKSKRVAKTEASPYERAYLQLKELVCGRTQHHAEFLLLRYPLFVLCYIYLLRHSGKEEAAAFISKYGRDLFKHQPVVKFLSSLLQKNFIDVGLLFRDLAPAVSLPPQARASFYQLVRNNNYELLEFLVSSIPIVDAPPETSRESVMAVLKTCPSSPYWEDHSEINCTKVYYGVRSDVESFLFAEGKLEQHLSDLLEDEEDNAAGNSKQFESKKRKLQKQYSALRKERYNPNAPPVDRIPLPRVTNPQRKQRIKAFKHSLKSYKINADNPPSACLFTLHNASAPDHQATCADFNLESTLLAVGFSSGMIRVWSITDEKLKILKPIEQLNLVSKDSENVYQQILDENKIGDHAKLQGHASTVTGVSFCPYSRYLLSSSYDGTVRLWSLLLWTPLVIFRGHVFPVFGVKFSPFGLYFASCGMDRTARLWSTEQIRCLRLFVGHSDSVDCVQFHPNGNYVASGSSDCSVRLWDVFSGNCVRCFTIPEETAIFAVSFTLDGRFLAFAAEGTTRFYDLEGKKVPAEIKQAHGEHVSSLVFSHGGTAWASGGLDNRVKVWSLSKLKELMVSREDDDDVIQLSAGAVDPKQLKLGDWPTKKTPVLHLHFTYTNVLLGVGCYMP